MGFCFVFPSITLLDMLISRDESEQMSVCLQCKMVLKLGWKGSREVTLSPRQGQLNPYIELEGDDVCWELFSHKLSKEQRQKIYQIMLSVCVRKPSSVYSNRLLNKC